MRRGLPAKERLYFGLKEKDHADSVGGFVSDLGLWESHFGGTYLALNLRKLLVIAGRLKGGFWGELAILSPLLVSSSSVGMTCWRSLRICIRRTLI